MPARLNDGEWGNICRQGWLKGSGVIYAGKVGSRGVVIYAGKVGW